MLTPDFKEFAALLNSNRVEYLVVGGYALAAYGHPRNLEALESVNKAAVSDPAVLANPKNLK
jgi:hypothetical protein